MTVSAPSDAGLYPRLLGTAWDELSEALRRLHHGQSAVHAAGVFRVQRGSNPLARCVAWLARLPAAGEAVDLRLVVAPREDGEEWRRTFAGRPLVSYQWQRPEGLLAERMGQLELGFRLTVADGSLLYQSVRAALRLGPLRLPLPHGSRPWVTASEKPGDGADWMDVWVDVRMPLVGMLVTYAGSVRIDEGRA